MITTHEPQPIINCVIEPDRLAITPMHQSNRYIITDTKTGHRLGDLFYTSESAHTVELFWGKGGLMGLVISPLGIKYFALPGSSVEVGGITLRLDGATLSSNPTKVSIRDISNHLIQKHSIQASILGAGLATRFERISGDSTNYSKPAIPLVGSRSVIECIANGLAMHGFTKLLVNTYFKPDSLKHSLAQSLAKEVFYIDEAEPSGTAGGLRKMLTDEQYGNLLDQNQHLLIVQGDSVTDADFSYLMETHVANNALVTIGCQSVSDSDVNKFGIIVTDQSGEDGQSGNITGFQEKPRLQDAKSRLGNTGFYIFSPKAFPLIKDIYYQLLHQVQETVRHNQQSIPNEVTIDFAIDIFPAILQKVQDSPSLGAFWAQTISGYWSDIGNPTQYVETVHDIYAGKVNFPLPEPMSEYYREGIIYWQDTAIVADKEEAQLLGNVIVAKPFKKF